MLFQGQTFDQRYSIYQILATLRQSQKLATLFQPFRFDTAHAMIAGQIIMHALRILGGKFERRQSVFLRQLSNHKGAILVKEKSLKKSNPNCYVCATDGLIVHQ